MIEQAVRAGALLRLRRDRYAEPDLPAALIGAGRLGGRLDCVSLVAAIGVFVRASPGTHLQFTPGSTRLPDRPHDAVAHWRHSRCRREQLAADLIEALAQATRCQSPRDAIATLDSAWHHRLVGDAEVAEIFARLPARFQVLRSLLDRRCESGSESLMRLLLRSLGAQVEIPVQLAGVGRVDFVVDGWLIVECDSKEHHQGWSTQRRDRRRDIAAARLGYTTIRPLAEDILYRTDGVREDLRAILAHGPLRAHRTNSTDRGTFSTRTLIQSG